MKNEKMLERCLELVEHLNTEDRKAFDYFRKTKMHTTYSLESALAWLIADLEADIASDCARASGRSAELAAAKRVITSGKKSGKVALAGAWFVGDRQYICDGYQGFRLNKALALETIAADVMPLNLDNVFTSLPASRTPLELPTAAEIKAYIKTEKANRKATKAKGAIEWDFGEGLPLVNAEFLLNALELLPGCTATCGKVHDPLHFVSDSGDGIVLPMRRH